MARYTSAYSALVVRLGEVRIMLEMAQRFEKKDPLGNAKKINAICRGGIVLLCGHVEGYIRELGELALSNIYEKEVCKSKISNLLAYYASKNYVDRIKDTSNANTIAETLSEMFASNYHLWGDSGPIASPISEDLFNRGFASPSVKNISKYLGRFGYRHYKQDLRHKIEAEMGAFKTSIDHLVDTRNKIAHGDRVTSKTPSDILATVKIVHKFCRATDQVFAKWCRENICSIR